MQITISNEILTKLPLFSISAYTFISKVTNDNKSLVLAIKEYEKFIQKSFTLESLLKDEKIKIARDAYKTLGKDPSRYKLAVESLFRRIIKGNGLYKVNDVVDCGNLLSLYTKKTIAVLDYNKIVGNVKARIGNKLDIYEGIGRGKIDVSNIIVYEDDISLFGSTTSDTYRTSISIDTKKVLIFIINFNQTNDEDVMIELYKKYTNSYNFERIK